MDLKAIITGFSQEYSLACLIYLLPLRKKPGWIIRYLLAVILQIIVNYLLLQAHLKAGISMIPAFFISFALGVFLFWLCAEGSFPDAVFGACCGYATQHLAYVLRSGVVAVFPSVQEDSYLLMAIITAATMLCCYLLFAQRLPIAGEYHVGWRDAVRSIVIVIPFAFFLSMQAEQFYDEGGNLTLYLICRVYAVFCCVFALWIQTSINEKVSVETEYRTRQMLWEKQREQYQISKENIDIINRKCHDLKYQVAALRQEQSESKRNESLDAIENSVMIYDSAMSTGNDVLDTILTERSLSCEQEHITWTCVADGSKLNHIDPVDLYILFGNILDNTIESVRKLEDPAQRVVSMNVYTRSNMVIIQVENYYSGTIQMENGLPKTTKPDESNHGFGMRSVKSIVEKYGGSISIDADSQIFLLSIVLPLNETSSK